MSLDVLKKEAALLDEQSRKDLMGFLVSLRGQDRTERARRLAEIRDDQDPSRWLTPEEFQERLGAIPEPVESPGEK